jgi:hypothetical protein
MQRCMALHRRFLMANILRTDSFSNGALKVIFATLLLTALPLQLHAESKAIATSAIALKNTENPAIDLLENGQPVDADRAADMRKAGIDLSTLTPAQSDVWSDTKLSAIEMSGSAYPTEPVTVNYTAMVPLNPEGWMRTQVQAIGSDGQMRDYRMLMSLNAHQALMRAALLRKLGYPVQSPKWYRQLRVRFKSEAEKNTFVGQISVQAGLVDHKRWVLSEDKTKNEILLQDVMLEPSTIIVPTSFYMGSISATHVKGRRTLRSLLVPFALVDVPESVNMYAWEPAQILNENLVFTHKYADAFDETTLDDVRWVSERIGRLTREDFREIVAAGQYPADIEAIIFEKTLSRRNKLLAYAGVSKRVAEANFAVNLTLTTGSVREGKVTKELYDGYALRFTHGDPESPLKTDDIVRFVKIEATSSMIHQMASLVNDKLELFPMDKLLQKRSENLYSNFLNYVKSNPTKPYVQPISTWGGPVGGISLNASRSIVTGSYYGDQSSDFRVSLVDQVSAGARVGYFLGVDGYPKVIPGFGANLQVIRSYVHVRPIPSMQAASKHNWNELFVPKFMRGLSKMLEPSTAEKAEDRQKDMTDNVTKFLDELKENETFTVTDTLAIGENASFTIPITTLLGLDPVSYAATISLGASANQVVLRRTTFTRENGLIKIYLQNIQSQMAGVQLDVNLWMNIMRLSYQHKWGQAQTRAYHLEEKPSDEAKLRKTILAMKGILSSNNSELLEANFNPYNLDHRTKSEISQGKFLFWQWTNIEEWHRVKVQPPKDPEKNFDPKKFERTLFSHRILERTGKNYYTFLGDVLDGLVQNSSFFKPGLLSGGGGSNPKDSFFGNARWATTSTEAEVTKGRESAPVTTVENFWAGWDLSKAELFKTIDGIDRRLKGLGLGLPLVDRDAFNDMRRLQLYEIRTTFIIYEAGMDKIRGKFLAKGGSKGSAFQRALGWDEYSGRDKEIVEKMLIPMYGKQRFDDYCYMQANRGEADRSTATSWKAVDYDCLMPWMWKILSLRHSYPTNREERVKWATRFMTLLERNVDLSKLIEYVGKENMFYQVKISGFRTRDENGDTADYRSSTVGTFNSKNKAGVFKDFVTDFNITSSEMNANYLSEGY